MRRIDPSDLVVAAAAVDTTGLTSSMVDQPEFVHRLYSKSEDAIVFTHDQNSGALLDDAVKAFETARPDVVYIPETAKLDPSSWSDSEVAPEQLALYDKLTKHLSLRTQGIITLLAGLVMSYAVTWTVLSPQQPTSRVFLPRDGTLGKQLSSARSDQSLAMGTDFLSLQLNNFLQCGVLLTLLTAFAVLFPGESRQRCGASLLPAHHSSILHWRSECGPFPPRAVRRNSPPSQQHECELGGASAPLHSLISAVLRRPFQRRWAVRRLPFLQKQLAEFAIGHGFRWDRVEHCGAPPMRARRGTVSLAMCPSLPHGVDRVQFSSARLALHPPCER